MSGAAPRRLPPAWKVAVLSALYFAQGLPFGFQANALPLVLTERGLSLEHVSLARALSLPWALKPLWAPFVDRTGSARFGRRKSWILPLQALLALACVGAAFVPPDQGLTGLLVLVLLMNLLAATQDIAVDGLAVDLLEERELGAGNAAQVVGYKVGMLFGGGVLVWLSSKLGWAGMFGTMAGLVLLAGAMLVPVREPAPVLDPTLGGAPGVPFRELVARLKAVARQPGAPWFLAAVATYKLGETAAESMFGPCLVRVHHVPKEDVALWLGTWGMVGSMLGSAAGALLAARMPLVRAVGLAAVVRGLPILVQWALVVGLLPVTAGTVIPIAIVEHFFGGMLTTTMFAWMMSQVDRRIGATHYTVLAALEVLGKSIPGLAAGWLVSLVGFGPLFLLGAGLSLAFVGLLVPLDRLAAQGGRAKIAGDT